MKFDIDLDDLDKRDIHRMMAECECWRTNRYFYLLGCAALILSSGGMLMNGVFCNGPTRDLISAVFAFPIGLFLGWALRKRWHGPAWSGLASKLDSAISSEA